MPPRVSNHIHLSSGGEVGIRGEGRGGRETGRQGDRETGRQGDRETGRQGDRETGGRRQGDKETRRQGDKETRRQGDKETRGQGDRETRGQGDRETGRQQGVKGTFGLSPFRVFVIPPLSSLIPNPQSLSSFPAQQFGPCGPQPGAGTFRPLWARNGPFGHLIARVLARMGVSGAGNAKS
jgi:hypothetical protein